MSQYYHSLLQLSRNGKAQKTAQGFPDFVFRPPYKTQGGLSAPHPDQTLNTKERDECLCKMAVDPLTQGVLQ